MVEARRGDASLVRLLVTISTLSRQLRQLRLATIGLEVGQDVIVDKLSATDRRTIGAVAASSHIRSSTLSKMVEQLLDRGLCDRSRDGVDRRQTTIGLTAAGVDMQERVREAYRRDQEEIARYLPDGITERMLEAVASVADALRSRSTKIRWEGGAVPLRQDGERAR